MKRETLRHPKLFDLMSQLNVSRPEALGLLTLLWDFTKDHAPRGDIGKWSDGAIARACDWTGPSDLFVKALVASKWLDRHEQHRLVIHDWHDHAESWVKSKLATARETFVTNRENSPSPDASPDTPPDASGDGGGDRGPPLSPHTNQTQPNQTKPKTQPNQTKPGGCGGDGLVGAKRLDSGTLQDSARLRAWCLENGLTTETDLLNAFGVAERAIEVGKKNPPGLFAKLVRERKWDMVTQAQEERARKRLRELRNGTASKAPPDVAPLGDVLSTIVGEVKPK